MAIPGNWDGPLGDVVPSVVLLCFVTWVFFQMRDEEAEWICIMEDLWVTPGLKPSAVLNIYLNH